MANFTAARLLLLQQGRHGRFLAGKATYSGGQFAAAMPLPRPLFNSQNLAKDQALTALPPVHGRGGPVMHSHRSVHP